MIRIAFSFLLGFVLLVKPLAATDPSPPAQQRLVLHLAPTIKVETWVTSGPSTATAGDVASSTPAGQFEAAIRVESSAFAGLLVHLEAYAIESPDECTKQATSKRLKLRIVPDVRDRWMVDIDRHNDKYEPLAVQTTSRKSAPATLIISGDDAPEEIVITSTIISRE